VYVPKAAEQVELRLLQVIQGMQAEMANQAGEMAKMKAAYTNEMAKMKAAHAEEMENMKAKIQEARRLGLPQDNAGSIESINATVQTLEGQLDKISTNVGTVDIQALQAGLEAVNSTVQALETQLENAVAALNASFSDANDCCVANTAAIANNTAALTRGDSDGDGVPDLDDGCPNDEGLTLFGAGLTDTSQCGTLSPSISTGPSLTPSLTPSISAKPSLTPSLTPSVTPSTGPSVSLAPTTCQQSIKTDSSGSELLVSFVS